jgi:hypothetical protein
MNFFDYAVNNSFILYKHNCKTFGVKPVDLFEFRVKLAHLLLKDTRTRKRKQSTLDDDTVSPWNLVVDEIGLKRGRCHHCVKLNRTQMHHTSFGVKFVSADHLLC